MRLIQAGFGLSVAVSYFSFIHKSSNSSQRRGLLILLGTRFVFSLVLGVLSESVLRCTSKQVRVTSRK